MPYKLNYKGTEENRFVRKIVRQASGCWLWSGSLDEKGYGYFRLAGPETTAKNVRAHRWAWQRINGPVPAGLELDHKCRNRNCVRPSHIEPVTHLENMRRGRWAMTTHCVNGHPLSGDNLRVDRRRGQRCCRACEKLRVRKHHSKHKV